MPNGFEQLAAILGPALTNKVMSKLGGKLIRIRKRFISIRAQYEDEEAYFEGGCTLEDGARRLGCTKRTLSGLRTRSRNRKKAEKALSKM